MVTKPGTVTRGGPFKLGPDAKVGEIENEKLEQLKSAEMVAGSAAPPWTWPACSTEAPYVVALEHGQVDRIAAEYER